MSHEEALAALEAKLERQEKALRTFFEAITANYVLKTVDVEIAAGEALEILRGVE